MKALIGMPCKVRAENANSLLLASFLIVNLVFQIYASYGDIFGDDASQDVETALNGLRSNTIPLFTARHPGYLATMFELAMMLGEFDLFAFRLFGFLVFSLLIVVIYLVGSIKDSRIGILAAFFFMFAWYPQFFQKHYIKSILTPLFSLSAMYLLYLGWERNQKLIPVSGFIAGIAVHNRGEALFIPIAMSAYLLIMEYRKTGGLAFLRDRRLHVLVISYLVTIAPFLHKHFELVSQNTGFISASQGIVFGGEQPGPLYYYLVVLMDFYTILFTSLFLVSAWFYIKRTDSYSTLIATSSISFFILQSLIPFKTADYLIFILPYIAIIVSSFIIECEKPCFAKRRGLAVLLICGIYASNQLYVSQHSVGASHFPVIRNLFDVQNWYYPDPGPYPGLPESFRDGLYGTTVEDFEMLAKKLNACPHLFIIDEVSSISHYFIAPGTRLEWLGTSNLSSEILSSSAFHYFIAYGPELKNEDISRLNSLPNITVGPLVGFRLQEVECITEGYLSGKSTLVGLFRFSKEDGVPMVWRYPKNNLFYYGAWIPYSILIGKMEGGNFTQMELGAVRGLETSTESVRIEYDSLDVGVRETKEGSFEIEFSSKMTGPEELFALTRTTEGYAIVVEPFILNPGESRKIEVELWE